MKIKVAETVYRDVNLPEHIVDEVTERRLMALVKPGEYLSPDGKFLKKDEDYGHGSITSKVVREATDLDRAVFAVLDAMREAAKKRRNSD